MLFGRSFIEFKHILNILLRSLVLSLFELELDGLWNIHEDEASEAEDVHCKGCPQENIGVVCHIQENDRRDNEDHTVKEDHKATHGAYFLRDELHEMRVGYHVFERD